MSLVITDLQLKSHRLHKSLNVTSDPVFLINFYWTISGRSSISHTGEGANPKRRGRHPTIRLILPENGIKMKKIKSRRGVPCALSPSNPPNRVTTNTPILDYVLWETLPASFLTCVQRSSESMQNAIYTCWCSFCAECGFSLNEVMWKRRHMTRNAWHKLTKKHQTKQQERKL